MDHVQEIEIREEGRAGLVTLRRPKALNAVTLDMIRALEVFYHRVAKNPHIYGIVMDAEGRAFSAGGDIRVLREWGMQDLERAANFYAEEYQHNWTLECFRKPHVALINGAVMGGGVGISLYGTHRVAGEAIRFAMPETGIGFFPDIGGGWFLPRMPGQLGMYLGLTGAPVGQADCYYLGVATHCVPSEKFEAIKAAMIEAEPIDAVLDDLHVHPGPAPLEALRPVIDRTFGAPSVEDILRALECEQGEYRDFAAKTLETLAGRAPLSLKVTFEQLRRGRSYRSLKEALIVEYRLARHFLALPDLFEGIRAIVVDKDQKPKWQPATLGEVSDKFVASLFEPQPKELALVDYWTIAG